MNAVSRLPDCPFSHSTISPSQRYLCALKMERDEILAAAYAERRATEPSCSYTPYGLESSPNAQYDTRGRQLHYHESVRQRQARLEFLRRQEFARRLALRGLVDSSVSSYAIKRLPPPRPLPAARLAAAITIQRAYRTYRALVNIDSLHSQLREACTQFEAQFADALAASSPSSYSKKGHRRNRSMHSIADINDTQVSTWSRTHVPLTPILRAHAAALGRVEIALAECARAIDAGASASTSASTRSTRLPTRNLASTRAPHPKILAALRRLAEALQGAQRALEVREVDAWVAELKAAARSARRRRGYALHVIEESDEESEESESTEEEGSETSSLSETLSTSESGNGSNSTSSSPYPRSPVSRTPSLLSIPEEEDEQ